MSFMFNNCSSLKKVEFISIDTTKVTNMSLMFQGCSELEYLDFSNIDTSNVADMKLLFSSCKKLKEIKGINNLNTIKVNNMSQCFKNIMN